MRTHPALFLLPALLAVMLAARPARAQPADLTPALLALRDLPVGWTATDAPGDDTVVEFCTGARGPRTPDPAAVATAAVAYTRSRTGPLVTETLTQLAPPAAANYIGDRVAQWPACAWRVDEEGGGRTDWQLAPLAFPDLGDAAAAWRLEATRALGAAQIDYVLVRRGDYVIALIHIATDLAAPLVDSALTETLARAALARLDAYLATV